MLENLAWNANYASICPLVEDLISRFVVYLRSELKATNLLPSLDRLSLVGR